ncbi:MAG: DoxX family protein [Bacteroidota bacterium]
MLIQSITLLSSISFIYYGIMCLFSKKMILEFERFGLTNSQRLLTGALQLLGSVGLLIGLGNALVGLIAAIGLTLLMLLGFFTRLKIRDSLGQSLPSFVFMLLNAYLALSYAGYI